MIQQNSHTFCANVGITNNCFDLQLVRFFSTAMQIMWHTKKEILSIFKLEIKCSLDLESFTFNFDVNALARRIICIETRFTSVKLNHDTYTQLKIDRKRNRNECIVLNKNSSDWTRSEPKQNNQKKSKQHGVLDLCGIIARFCDQAIKIQ